MPNNETRPSTISAKFKLINKRGEDLIICNEEKCPLHKWRFFLAAVTTGSLIDQVSAGPSESRQSRQIPVMHCGAGKNDKSPVLTRVEYHSGGTCAINPNP